MLLHHDTITSQCHPLNMHNNNNNSNNNNKSPITSCTKKTQNLILFHHLSDKRSFVLARCILQSIHHNNTGPPPRIISKICCISKHATPHALLVIFVPIFFVTIKTRRNNKRSSVLAFCAYNININNRIGGTVVRHQT